MNLWEKFLRKFFLVKEIVSKEGIVHFRRYRLLQTPWCAVYIHRIMKSDEDKHMHDHPWGFYSFILEGAYKEITCLAPDFDLNNPKELTYYSGNLAHHTAEDCHKLTLISSSVLTLVFVYGKRRVWGYQTEQGWIDFKSYRALKNEGKFRK
jgi:hypothetical protein